MVGLAALSHAAFQQEWLLEQIGAGERQYDDSARQLLSSTYDRMETYLSDLSSGSVDDAAFLLEVVAANREYRGQSVDGAKDEVTSVLSQAKAPIVTNGESAGDQIAQAARGDSHQSTEPAGMEAYIDDFCRQADVYLRDVRKSLAEWEVNQKRNEPLVHAPVGSFIASRAKPA